MIDIDAFDAVSESEQGHEFELKEKDGVTGTGVVLVVIGKHADAVTKHAAKIINQAQRDALMAQKSGKPAPMKTLEELREQNIEAASIRVTGWKNVKQPFSADLLKNALRRNPHWIDQIVEASDDLGNFSRKQPQS